MTDAGKHPLPEDSEEITRADLIRLSVAVANEIDSVAPVYQRAMDIELRPLRARQERIYKKIR